MTAATPDVAHSMRGPVILWAALSALALGYLALLTLKPELIGTWSVRADASAALARSTSAAVLPASGATEVEVLRQTVSQLKSDLADMKSALAAGEEREKAILARLASIEQPTPSASSPVVTSSIGPATDAVGRPLAIGSADPPVAQPPGKTDAGRAHPEPTIISAAQPEEDSSSAEPGKAVTRKAVASSLPAKTTSDAPSKSAKADARKASTAPAPPAGDADRSFAPPAAPATPATALAARAITSGNSYGVQLASGPSLDTLRISWALLNDRHAALLKGLQPRYAETNDPDANMALVAGPMTKAEDAARVCSNLKARRITCSVVSFDGGKAL